MLQRSRPGRMLISGRAAMPQGEHGNMMIVESKKLAHQLFRDDLSRAEEVAVERNGRRAYEAWLAASSDAGDGETREALEAADEDEFAAEWERMVGERSLRAD